MSDITTRAQPEVPEPKAVRRATHREYCCVKHWGKTETGWQCESVTGLAHNTASPLRWAVVSRPLPRHSCTNVAYQVAQADSFLRDVGFKCRNYFSFHKPCCCSGFNILSFTHNTLTHWLWNRMCVFLDPIVSCWEQKVKGLFSQQHSMFKSLLDFHPFYLQHGVCAVLLVTICLRHGFQGTSFVHLAED